MNEQSTLALEKIPKPKPARDSWGEVVQYLDGLCFGIAPSGMTIYLGKEAEIKEMLADSAKRSGNSLIDKVIDRERELNRQKENKDGRQSDSQRPSAFRGRTAGKAKRGAARIKPTSFRKRLPRHSAKH